MNKYFEELAPSRQPGHHPANVIDPEILLHHIPGGMISNLRSQLEQQGALDKLDEVLAELPRVRADLGYPPLVTPTSQIVGVQAVMNVISGDRYSMVTQETKNLVKGLYGRTPSPIAPKIVRKILGTEKQITCRPADQMEPLLPKATEGVEPGLIKTEEDIISFCLFPQPALDYFKWRSLPSDKRGPTPADMEGKPAPKKTAEAPPTSQFLTDADYKEISSLADKVNQLGLSELTIRRDDLTLSLKGNGMTAAQSATAAAAPTAKDATPAPKKEAAKSAPVAEAPPPITGPTINAPLNGNFYNSSGPGKPPLASEGDKIKAGEPICIVEAMKLFNQIKAPYDCKIVKILVENGTAVKKDQPLVVIEKV
jgi:oxaloacetate decarboxylase alpha subunit